MGLVLTVKLHIVGRAGYLRGDFNFRPGNCGLFWSGFFRFVSTRYYMPQRLIFVIASINKHTRGVFSKMKGVNCIYDIFPTTGTRFLK